MRTAIVVAIFAIAILLAPSSASAAPPVLADHAASAKAQSAGLVEQVARRSAYGKRAKARYKRRYDWTYYPYWRPYQYRYWQYYYPYGGPLF